MSSVKKVSIMREKLFRTGSIQNSIEWLMAKIANAMTTLGKLVATEVHSNQVSPAKPTLITDLVAPIKQPSKPDSGKIVIPTNFPGQPGLQGHTLTPGQAITHSGTLISLASDGSQLIAGASTQAVELPPSVTHQAGVPVVGQQVVARPADGLTPQPIDSLTLESGVPSTMTWTPTPVAANKAPFPARASNKAASQPFERTQLSELPSEGQSAAAEGQQQSFIPSHIPTAGASISVFGTSISLAPGLPSIVMGTNVQATGSHVIGSSDSGLSNGTSPLAFQGSATRIYVSWGWFVTIACFTIISVL